MPSPTRSTLDEVLLCPICMVTFEGRILQCSQGHAVCEACQVKLTECPTCRGVYLGTRNYVLENVIAKLKQIDNTSLSERTQDDNAREGRSTIEAPVDVVSSDEAFDIGQTEAATSVSVNLFNIPAPKGFYRCLISGCDTMLPFCRILNHLRYFHKDILTERKITTTNLNEDGDYVDHWSMPCATFQKAFHLRNYGILFLIVNVTDAIDRPRNIKAWVQGSYPNRLTRRFRFSLELLMGNMLATFTDYVVGASSDTQYIQGNGNCLNVNTTEYHDNFTIEMKISKTVGALNLQRNDRTYCRVLPASVSGSPQSQNQSPENSVNTQDLNRPR